MKPYKHLFFDLDRTFWDVETNQIGTHRELYETYKLGDLFQSFESYYCSFSAVNNALWKKYSNGQIRSRDIRTTRFQQLFTARGIRRPKLAETLNEQYLEVLPRYNKLLPHAVEALDYLREKGYPMHIITNGFDHVQQNKMRYSGILDYFDKIIISETIGINKPFAGIFEYALAQTGAEAQSSAMVGDDIVNDIQGGAGVGMDTVWLNSDKSKAKIAPTYEIRNLSELKRIF